MRLLILHREGRAWRWIGTLPEGSRTTAGTRPGWPRRFALWLDRQFVLAILGAESDRAAGRSEPGRW